MESVFYDKIFSAWRSLPVAVQEGMCVHVLQTMFPSEPTTLPILKAGMSTGSWALSACMYQRDLWLNITIIPIL